MDLFTPIVKNIELHQKFKYLLEPTYNTERGLLSDWWNDFVIKDGEKKTIKQFQTTFHSMFWEIYLNKVILESGCTIDSNVTSPDFVINFKDNKVSIEAVVANIASQGKKESERTINDVFGENDIDPITNESITRLFNSIDSKSKKYFDKYHEDELVKSNPFIIALADYGQVNYGQTYIYSMLALLYSAFYDPDEKSDLKILCSDNFNREYKFKELHFKENGKALNIGLFQRPEYSHIAAIMYSSTLSLGKLTSLTSEHEMRRFILLDRDIPSLDLEESTLQLIRYSGSNPDEVLNDGLFVFHNPYADKPLEDEFLQGRGVTHVKFDLDEYELNIEYTELPPLKRRRVGYPGEEYSYVDGIESFSFYPVEKHNKKINKDT